MSQTQTMLSNKDALIRLSSIIIFVTGVFQFFVGIKFISLINSGSSQMISYILLFIGGVALIALSIIEFANEKLDISLSANIYTLIVMFEIIIWYFIPPSGTNDAVNIEIGNTIGMFGVFFLLVAIRPNFGPTANKKIYQAVAGIMAFFVAIALLILGLYVSSFLDIAKFAGRGTQPTESFVYDFISPIPFNEGELALKNIRLSGLLMIFTAIFIMITVLVRNKINLKVASIGLMVGILWTIADVITFANQWDRLDTLFYNTPELQPIYNTMLALNDPGVVTTAVILIILFTISLIMMIYASFASKPIMAWRRKRDSSIAAAEVFFREGKLPSAIKYLERAAQLSSKIDEEDKAVELLTRIKQIKDKSIKMKKAEAAEKAKKAYEKQQKAEKAAQAKARREKQVSKAKSPSKKQKAPPKKSKGKQPTKEDEELKRKMREAMNKNK